MPEAVTPSALRRDVPSLEPSGPRDDPGAMSEVVGIAPHVVRWQRLHGRHDLPWQNSSDPYRIWLSEVMLQQTQVATVIPYFQRFIAAFPKVDDLAGSPVDQVMSLWSGLGYYSRARNLHAAARLVAARGGFPRTAVELAGLPGVGRSTAAAIAVFGFGERAAILDGNVKRLFSRVFAVDGHPGESSVMRTLWAHAQAELPAADDAAEIRSYTQGLMDLGATVCTRSNPDCGRCPLQDRCSARRQGLVARYPAPRPRRQVPVREVDMVLFCNRDAVLIELRPPAGIWGGLWSLPETRIAEGDESVHAGGLVLGGGAMPTLHLRFEHAFTHFRMKAKVWKAELDAAEAGRVVRQSAATRWLPLAEVETAPLPGPIKSLLLSLGRSSLL